MSSLFFRFSKISTHYDCREDHIFFVLAYKYIILFIESQFPMLVFLSFLHVSIHIEIR